VSRDHVSTYSSNASGAHSTACCLRLCVFIGGGGGGDGGGTGGSLGAVAYQIAARASVKSDRSMQKLTVGVLELAAEVTHYVVPSLEAAAYLKVSAHACIAALICIAAEFGAGSC
jgi:hypothetical protein